MERAFSRGESRGGALRLTVMEGKGHKRVEEKPAARQGTVKPGC